MTSLAIRKEPEATYISVAYPIDIAIISDKEQYDKFISKRGIEDDEFIFDGMPCTYDFGDALVVTMAKFGAQGSDESFPEYVSYMVHEANHVKQYIYKFIKEDMAVSCVSETDSYLLGSITEAMASILM